MILVLIGVENMLAIKGYSPKSNNCVLEGARLALYNLFILVIGGSLVLGIFWGVGTIRKIGFPIPIPVGLVMLLTGIPYFVCWFKYGRMYGDKIKNRKFIKGLTVGLISQIPGAIILLLLYTKGLKINIPGDVHRILFIFLSAFIITLPIMTGLGAIGEKRITF